MRKPHEPTRTLKAPQLTNTTKTDPHKPEQNGMHKMTQKEVKPLREELWKKNNKHCPICEREILSEECALDHCHDSGQIRDTICKKCNLVEGQIRAKWKRSGLMHETNLGDYLIKMGEYINNDHLPLIHPSEWVKNPKLMKSSYRELEREIKKYNKFALSPIKFPEYPKSKRLTKRLKELFDMTGIYPRYYGAK